ncbi:hypothetical protein CKO15_12500 [Halorhodospira abdelmalekii]|uniref:hypothetical protein n=1 Tax=Halorhodospira abdelmalekii TaxID=421629 RepID=UPI001908376F|nr:hypothetical protein [Halorhodospira abdelmalekii]MBK1736076.1 hypothetical protein [Halorhodospira abdelmalekii]
MTAFAVLVLLALLALREACSNRMRRNQHSPTAVRRWRTARHWQNIAIALALIAFFPSFTREPEFPVLGDIHNLLHHTWPLVLIAAGIASVLGVRAATPLLRREMRRRQATQEREDRARHGVNPERLSRGLRMWILEHGPAFDYRFDVATTHGNGNIIVGTEQGDYMIYVLPSEHAREGYPTALRRCGQIAEALAARGVIWIPDEHAAQPRSHDEAQIFVLRGSIVDIFRWIERTTEVQKRMQERREQRRTRALRAAQGAETHWGKLSAEEASARHDREAWDRFARKAPLHPDMRERLFKRHGGRCALCGFAMEGSRRQWDIVVTDYDHICRYHGKTRLVPFGVQPATSYEMPDCEQCHIDAPGHFEACASRLAPVHIRCQDEHPPPAQGTGSARPPGGTQ